MSDTPLLPERQLAFSPGLAATIGLEEAVLLQHLDSALAHHPTESRGGYAWLNLSREWLLQTLPFWNVDDIQRICRSLVDKGLILVGSAQLRYCDHLQFALNQRIEPHQQRAGDHSRAGSGSTPGGAHALPGQWSPSADMLQLLAINHGIPQEFCQQQVEDFVLYWRERGEISHAWENKFRQHVISRWRHHQQDQAEAFRRQEAGIGSDWQPSEDALEILQRVGINHQFVEDAIPEFVLYWSEREDKPKALNSTFVAHVKRQWARYTAVMANDAEPRPITANWQPSRDVYDILGMSHIDTDFARKLIAEFVMYWMERGDAQASWNTRFLQHVKYHWARAHQIQSKGHADGGQQTSHRPAHPRARSLEQDLTDRSWAN